MRLLKQPWLLNAILFKVFANKKREANASRQARAVAEAIITRVKDKLLQDNIKREVITRREEHKVRQENVYREALTNREGKSSQNNLNLDTCNENCLGNCTKLEGKDTCQCKCNSRNYHENILEHSKNTGNPNETGNTAPLYNFVEVIIQDQLNPNIPKHDVLTHDELVSEIIVMLFAGMDTTKTANVIVLIMLALHPTIQQEVFNEIQTVMGTDPTVASTYNQLQELHVLTRVIKESLRLFPSAPLLGRTTAEEFQIDGHTIPKGAAIWVPIFSSPHRDPNYWPNPDRFDPDRFLPSETEARNPNAYIPFSIGARNCIGQKYAMLQMKTMISTILRRYRILPGEQCKRIEDIRWEFHLTMKLLDGNDIRLEPRE
ncbi:hypothetical protein WDU94_010529 [Cyamophila willieti]